MRKRCGKPMWFLRQYTCKSDVCQVFFSPFVQITQIKQVSCASAKAMCKTDRVARAIVPATGSRVKYYLHVRCKFIIIREVSATGAKIVENWCKFEIILDIPTPRAAPRNSLAFFARMEGKSFDTGCCC